MKIKKQITEILFFTILVILLIQGRNFADFSLPKLPGKIMDQTILFLALINFKNVKLFVVKYKTYLFLIPLSILIGLNTKNWLLSGYTSIQLINFIGQDLLIFIYLIFLIPIFSQLDFNFLKSKIYLIVVFTEIVFITDFIFERVYFFKKFLIFDFSFLSNYLVYFNFVDLKASEILLVNLFFIYILNKNYSSESKKFYLALILIGIVFGFYSTQSKGVLISTVLFTSLLFIQNFKNFKIIILIFIGFIISFLFNFEINDNKVRDFVNEKFENSEYIESSSNRVRLHSEKCIFLYDKSNSECEIIVPNYDVEYQIEKLILVRNIVSKNKEFINKADDLEILNEINSFEDCQIKEAECEKILMEPYYSSLNEFENYFCGNSTSWRLNLWQGSYDYYSKNIFKIFFGYGVGFGIPELLVENKNVYELCYSEVINLTNPLRSLHNTFFTILFRFGIIGFSIFCNLLFKLFKKENSFFIAILFPLIFITFVDPLFDSPIALFLFIYLYFFDKRLNNIDDFI